MSKDFWLDDPEWEALRRKAESKPISKDLRQRMAKQQRPGTSGSVKREQPRAQAKRQDTDAEVVVNLKLAIPKVKPPDFKKLFRTHKNKIIKVGAAALVLITFFGAFKLISGRDGGQVAGDSDTPIGQAEFKALVPLEGFTDGTGKKLPDPEFKYDKERDVLGYETEYNGAKLTISQQALPDQLKSHPGQIEGIARTVNANIPIETQKGRVYLATDDKTKAQVLVFATKDAMVFVRSTEELGQDEWTVFVNQLTEKSE